MDNPTTFDWNLIIPSDLSNNNIIMLGRADDEFKRFDLGIIAMKTIIKDIPNCEMNIASFPLEKYKILIKYLSLEKNVKFLGYQENIEIFLKNSSLHILTSLSESYPMVLSETKIFGIPSIICGLDFLALAKEGTVIIYDDNPTTIAKESIKILKNDSYRKKLGKRARNSMKSKKNTIIAQKWKDLILSIYNGKESYYMDNSNRNNIMTEKEANKMLNNQLILLKRRKSYLCNLTLDKLKNYYLK